MKKIISVLLILIFVLLIFCSCSDGIEPERRIIITAIGLDQKNGKLIMGIESADMISNKSEDVYNPHFISASGESLEEVIKNLENCSYGKLMFSQCPIVLIGESLSDKYFKEFLNFCLNEDDMSLSVRLLYCKNAEKILNQEHDNNDNNNLTGYEILKLIEYGNVYNIDDRSDKIPSIYDSISKGKSFKLPVIMLYKDQIKISEVKRMKVK